MGPLEQIKQALEPQKSKNVYVDDAESRLYISDGEDEEYYERIKGQVKKVLSADRLLLRD